MKKPVIILTLLAIALGGCKIDTAGLPGAGNSGAALLLGKWFIKSQATVGTAFGFPVSDNETDFTSQDFYVFNKDGSVNISQLTSGNGVSNGTYSYDSKGQTLTLTDPTGQASTVNVIKLTTDSLVYTLSVSVPALQTQQLVSMHFARK